ncbi:DUF5693 family protein [Natroniella sulfidigena]|uniref:DUF5693 family protein n=1 Tax=Natroniella sulfidigena TaxID=723921 RepID=UPI00200A0E60|nr:DUF5693 family protein [Natroniella sulfidigena]MCK8816003.1 DUF5693 family protein [Natroniella sulfidigena]
MKKLLTITLIAILVLTGILVARRQRVESQNRAVELVIDYSMLREFEQDQLLPQLKELGLTTVGLEMDNLEQLATDGQLSYYQGHQVSGLTAQLTELPELSSGELYLSSDNQQLLEQLEEVLAKRVTLEPVGDKGLKITDYEEDLLEFPLYFSEQKIELFSELGLQIIPRVPAEIEPQQLDSLLAAVEDSQQIIFSGEEVVGYPDKLELTAQQLRARGIKLGMIEPFIARQDGSGALARLLDLETVRAHSMEQEELDFLGIERTVARYLRAVRERNVRTLYLRPFDEPEDTLEFIERLVEGLEVEGYNSAEATPFVDLGEQLDLKLGLVALLVLLNSLLLKMIGLGWLYVVGSGFLLLAVGHVVGVDLSLEILALVVAISLPCYIFVYLINKVNVPLQLSQVLKLFLQVSLASIAGGLIISALLADRRYLLQIRQFRGVKLAFMLPLVISFAYGLFANYGDLNVVKRKMTDFLEQPVLWKEVLVLLLISLGGLIYLGRTGNNPAIPVSATEVLIRENLERILTVRPRFKSFLIGHPVLVLGIGLAGQAKKYSWLLLIGLIGQINILNTFSHLHTPLLISLIRVGQGVVLGAIIGCAVLYFLAKRKY